MFSDQEMHLEIVQLFLKQPNVNLDYSSNLTKNPMAVAAKKGHLDIFKEFLLLPEEQLTFRSHAIIEAASIHGHTEIVIALANHHSFSKDKLTIRGGYQFINAALEHGRTEIIRAILSHSSFVESLDESGRILNQAVSEEQPEAVKVILENIKLLPAKKVRHAIDTLTRLVNALEDKDNPENKHRQILDLLEKHVVENSDKLINI